MLLTWRNPLLNILNGILIAEKLLRFCNGNITWNTGGLVKTPAPEHRNTPTSKREKKKHKLLNIQKYRKE